MFLKHTILIKNILPDTSRIKGSNKSILVYANLVDITGVLFIAYWENNTVQLEILEKSNDENFLKDQIERYKEIGFIEDDPFVSANIDIDTGTAYFYLPNNKVNKTHHTFPIGSWITLDAWFLEDNNLNDGLALLIQALNILDESEFESDDLDNFYF